MDTFTFAQIQAARRQHFESSATNESQPQQEQEVQLSTRTINTVDGIHSQRCGGGRRIIRKRLGGN